MHSLESSVTAVNNAIENCKYLSTTGLLEEMAIDAGKYALSAGGKRIRPVLCMEFYKLFGGDEDISDIAIALEIMHTFSLIHDDLPEMDNDDYRRGKPSTHIKYGVGTALLAGDGLCLLPFEIISDSAISGKISFETATCLSNLLSKASGNRGMILGQMLDTEYGDEEITLERLIRTSRYKTGCLLEVSCKFGAVLAGCDNKDIESAGEYGRNLGLAFQIIDDILDVTSSQELLGKPIGSDKDNGKTTYVDILGLEKAKELAKEYTKNAVNCIRNYNNSKLLCELAERILNRVN